MSSPRLAPWLMPETISSGSNSTSPSAAKRTQSTGVPSVAKPLVPSSKRDLLDPQRRAGGDAAGGRRAVRVRRDHGQLDARAARASARRIACRPLAWMPSSFVRRTFMEVHNVSQRDESLSDSRHADLLRVSSERTPGRGRAAPPSAPRRCAGRPRAVARSRPRTAGPSRPRASFRPGPAPCGA